MEPNTNTNTLPTDPVAPTMPAPTPVPPMPSTMATSAPSPAPTPAPELPNFDSLTTQIAPTDSQAPVGLEVSTSTEVLIEKETPAATDISETTENPDLSTTSKSMLEPKQDKKPSSKTGKLISIIVGVVALLGLGIFGAIKIFGNPFSPAPNSNGSDDLSIPAAETIQSACESRNGAYRPLGTTTIASGFDYTQEQYACRIYSDDSETQIGGFSVTVSSDNLVKAYSEITASYSTDQIVSDIGDVVELLYTPMIMAGRFTLEAITDDADYFKGKLTNQNPDTTNKPAYIVGYKTTVVQIELDETEANRLLLDLGLSKK